MSRYVEWGGKLWERGFFNPPLKLSPGTCPNCGGLGVVPESIDEERYDVAVPCHYCRMYCKTCGKYVKRKDHVCGEAKP